MSVYYKHLVTCGACSYSSWALARHTATLKEIVELKACPHHDARGTVVHADFGHPMQVDSDVTVIDDTPAAALKGSPFKRVFRRSTG